MILNYKIIGTALAAFALSVVIITGCFFITADASERALNLAILVTGYAIGWVIGVLATPYGSGEEQRFAGYKQAISAFVGGYLISKLDSTLVNVLSWNTLQSNIAAYRLFSFTSAILISLLITFVFRRYAR